MLIGLILYQEMKVVSNSKQRQEQEGGKYNVFGSMLVGIVGIRAIAENSPSQVDQNQQTCHNYPECPSWLGY